MQKVQTEFSLMENRDRMCYIIFYFTYLTFITFKQRRMDFKILIFEENLQHTNKHDEQNCKYNFDRPICRFQDVKSDNYNT